MRKVLTLSGSIRQGSYNQQLAWMMGRLLRDAGAEVTDIALGDYPLPMFNEDLEKADGKPDTALALGQMFVEADAIFIATPEYNGGMTPLLTNTIAWLSRTGLRPFSKATFGLGAVSSGPISGMLSLSHMHDVFMKAQALVAPTSLWVGFADKAFTEDGMLADKTLMGRAESLAGQLMKISR